MSKKSEIMRKVVEGIALECFTHTEEGQFLVAPTMELARQYGILQEFDLSDDLIQHIKDSRDWEEDRVRELTVQQMYEPSLWLRCHDGSDLLVDGTHRLIKRHQCGYATAHGYFMNIDYGIRPSQLEVKLAELLKLDGQDWGRFKIVNGQVVPRSGG